MSLLFLHLIQEGWVKGRGGRAVWTSPNHHHPPPPADLCTSGCLKNIYTVCSMGGLSIHSRLEAGYLYSSSLTACGTLCGEGSVPLCPSPPLTSSATHRYAYESYSNLVLSMRLEERTALKVILFVM